MQRIYFKWVTENYFFFVPEGQDAWRNKTTGLHEYTFNFKAWSLINDRWPHQQLLYTTLIFRAGLSRKEATVGGVRAPSPHAASCGIWASFLESTLHDAKVAYESLFSRCLCSSPSTIDQWVSFFPLFISLFNLHCYLVCFVIISRVTCNSGSSSAAALYFKVQWIRFSCSSVSQLFWTFSEAAMISLFR